MTKTSTLWVFFGLFVVESLSFGAIMTHWDFILIDEMSDPETIRRHIQEMSDVQRTVHAWTTVTLDVAYPLTYGPLFAGLSLRAFRPAFSIPAIAVIPTDLTEGVVQVMALAGNENLLWLKAYVTPLKLLLFMAAMIIAIIAIARSILNLRDRAA